MNSSAFESMLEEFDGCEGGDPGTPTSPSIWLFGIEPGNSVSDRREALAPPNPVELGYTVDIQRKWPFNRNAFKLLAAMKGLPVSNFREFAELRKPFVVGSKGYFKGNLFPYACRNTSDWPDDAIEETGMQNKAEYQAWCRSNRWLAISKWVEKYEPQVFIGVGNSFRKDFAMSVFGKEVELDEHVFTVNGCKKKLFHNTVGKKRLVVIPHLSRGLHENAALQYAGKFIAAMI